MLEATYKLKLGQDEFELKATVKDEKELFEIMSFYTNLPKAAPKGATDLKMVFRTTKKGHKYYSLISESEKMEFKLGQNLEANGGGLFCKGWDTLFNAKEEDDQGQAQVPNASPVQVGQQPARASTLQVGGSVGPSYSLPPVNNVPPAAVTAPYVAPTINVAPQAPVVPQQPQIQAAPQAPVQAAPAVNPQTTQQAANVLARFGLK